MPVQRRNGLEIALNTCWLTIIVTTIDACLIKVIGMIVVVRQVSWIMIKHSAVPVILIYITQKASLILLVYPIRHHLIAKGKRKKKVKPHKKKANGPR